MLIILTCLLAIVRLLDLVTTPLFKWKARHKRLYLPPLKSDLIRISATELAKKIRRKEICSEEICKVYINRIKEVNSYLNAVVQDRFKDAIREARNVDSYLNTTSLSSQELEKFKPLLGVPVTVKESCAVEGLSICVGLNCRKNYKAETDGEAVARLRSCGAIVLLVSAAPELCISWETYSPVNGRTNNPYDTTCTSGGSSGGEGVLLGAGASLLGIGSDVGGSIRLPALFNGVFGHKPTPRIIPLKGHWPICQDEKCFDFMVIGPMTRYAVDLKLMMKVMCGNKLSSELKFNESINLRKLNVFYMEDFGFSVTRQNVSFSIRNHIYKCVKHLEKNCGAKVNNYKFEAFKESMEICGSAILNMKDMPNVMKWESTNFILEVLKSLIGKSKFSLNLLYYYLIRYIFKFFVADYSKEIKELKCLVKEKLGNDGILIMPTFMNGAHKHNQMFFKNGFVYLLLANVLGLPSTSIPCGFDENGLPIGLQVMAAPYQDRLCLAVAEELERFFGGWLPPPEKS